MKLYKYTGTISEVAIRHGSVCSIKLYDMSDPDKAPTRLDIVGAIGRYIDDIECTDAEERYLPTNYYFDDNLRLWRIEVPSDPNVTHGIWSGHPAKIITQSPDSIDHLEIFGEPEYIRCMNPEAMSGEEMHRWLMWERQNMK